MLSESNPITSSISAKIKTFYATQICSQLTLLTSEISGFLGQSPKPCPKKQRIAPSKATELCTAASRRAREKRAGVTREDIITVNISNLNCGLRTPSCVPLLR